MTKNILAIFLVFFTTVNLAYSAAQKNELLLEYKSTTSINNKASLQRGAKYFVNYCSGCHSLKYMRMSTLAEDLDIDEAIFSKNLLFNNKKIGETMTISMKEKDAIEWFNAVPPDLSLTSVLNIFIISFSTLYLVNIGSLFLYCFTNLAQEGKT